MKGVFRFRVMITMAVVLGLALPVLAGGLPKPSSKNPEAQKLIDQAWALGRSDSSAEIYKKCVALMEQADKLDPNNHTILTDIARYYWEYGDNLPKKTPEQQKGLVQLYTKGMAAAEKSMKIKETAGNHYWFAVNKSSSLEFSNVAAQAAAFPTIYSHSKWVEEHDINYYYGAIGRLWSEILCRVPKVVVKMVGWDVNEAVENINRSIKNEPRYLDNYYYKARFMFYYFENKAESIKLLEWTLKQDPNIFPDEVTANKVTQRKAREFWKIVTGKEYP